MTRAPLAIARRPALRTKEPDGAAFTWTLVLTAVLFLRPQDIIPPLALIHPAELSAVVGWAALVLGRLQRRQPVTRWTPELFVVCAFGAVILLTAPFSIWIGGSIAVFTDLYVKVILVYLLAVNVIDSPDRLERLSWVLILSVGYIGFRAVLDYARGVNLIANGTRVMGSVGGIMENPNDLALNMVAFLPLAVVTAMRPGAAFRRLVAAGCALSMLGAVVASGSRGGFLGLIAMVVVLAAFAIRQRPGLVITGALVVLCALPVLPASYWRRIESITDPSKDDFETRESRKTLFSESYEAFVENPLTGVGAGEFKDWNPQKRVEAWRETHNVWLQVASELGIFGFAVFAVLVSQAFFAVYRTRRMLRKMPNAKWRMPLDAHSAAMAASLTGWFVCAFFASVAYNWTFYYLLVLVAAPRDILRSATGLARSGLPTTPPGRSREGLREVVA